MHKTIPAVLNKASLDISVLPKGLYYVGLDIAGAGTTKKLIKK